MKKIIKIIVIVLLICVIAVSSIFIYKANKDDDKAENEFEEIADIMEQNNAEDKENRPLNLQEVYKINSDVIGWLRIAGTNINYPVMQTKNNLNYYLRRNIYKQYSVWGTPYLAEECDIHTSNNLIVYGHHIKGNRLFGELEKYKNRAFLENHKIIEFTTLDTVFEYEIIDIVVKNISDPNIHKYYSPKFKVENGEQLITLSTCEYSTKNGRLLVIARKLD